MKKKRWEVISTGAVGVAEEEQVCQGCGMPKRDWEEPEGIQVDGKTYCCEGCEEGTGGTGCTC